MLGCTKLVLIPPFWPTMPLFCKVFVDAAKQVGVKQIIMVSIMDTSATPTPLYKQWFSEVPLKQVNISDRFCVTQAEKYVQESGMDYTIIKSAFLYSNLLFHSENIKGNSKIVQNTDPEGIHSKDKGNTKQIASSETGSSEFVRHCTSNQSSATDCRVQQ